ncbi:hypothetical protein LIER_06887 [Lithospermum erythrorhizon]|uniref:Uncharacterized protein n=1 Tax=Lithospermum erythrorhizon TaxID=34254 RepID=A0AAV3P7E4_LITER
MATYLHTHSGATSKLVGPHMAKYGGLYRRKPYDSVTEARGRSNTYHPGWTALRPRWKTSLVFLDHTPQSHEDVTFFFSLRTNMSDSRYYDWFEALEYLHDIPNRPEGSISSFNEFTSRSKDYQAWLGKVLSCGSARSFPRILGKSKGLLVLPNPVLKRKVSLVSISEDRDPKHARGVCLEGSGSTHAASCESDQPVDVSSSLSGGACTEIVDTSVSHGDRRIYSSDEESILASFQALAEFRRQDLTSHCKKLKAMFSKARPIEKVQRKAASSKIHNNQRIGLRLRHELSEMDAHIEALHDQVTSRESMIVCLEVEKSKFVLKVASLEEGIKKGQGDRLE